MRIVLFDYNVEGHHFTYLNLISLALYNQGYNIIIMSPCKDLNKYTLNGKDRVNIFPINNCPPEPIEFNFLSTRRYIINLWKYTADELNQINLNRKEDLIFFPSIDEYITAYIPLYTIGKVFKYNWVGLYIKPRYLRVKQNYHHFRKGILDINYLLKLKSCKSIAVLDSGIIDTLKIKLPGKKIVFLPDIISEEVPDYSFPEYDEIVKQAGDRIIVLLIGAIDRRKGLINLLEAAKLLDQKKYFFVVAGKIFNSTFSSLELIKLNELLSGLNNLYFFTEIIASEGQFNAIISLCDILFASYLDFPYSSNMVGKAAFFNKHILVSKGYLMQEIVEKYDLGLAVGNNTGDLIKAIETLSIQTPNEAGRSKYVEEYSWNNFCSNLNDLVN